jgi:hypothetical protein
MDSLTIFQPGGKIIKTFEIRKRNLEILTRHGLYLTRTPDGQPLSFDKTADEKQILAWIELMFPAAWENVKSSLKKDHNGITKNVVVPCIKKGNKYSLVRGKIELDGGFIERSLPPTRKKCGAIYFGQLRGTHLIINPLRISITVTTVPIDEQVYSKWNPNGEGESDVEDYLGRKRGGYSTSDNDAEGDDAEGDDAEDDELGEDGGKGKAKLQRVNEGESFAVNMQCQVTARLTCDLDSDIGSARSRSISAGPSASNAGEDEVQSDREVHDDDGKAAVVGSESESEYFPSQTIIDLTHELSPPQAGPSTSSGSGRMKRAVRGHSNGAVDTWLEYPDFGGAIGENPFL